MHWADDVHIETPEQIDVSLELAGLGSRFVAQILDWLVKWGVFAIIAVLAVIVMGFSGAAFNVDSIPIVVGAVLAALFYAFLLGFDIYYELRHNGQTPGKRSAGIRVVRENGAPLDFQAACVRNLVALADFLPFFYLLGSLLILMTRRHQRLGDLAAGTIVVRERVAAVPEHVDTEVERLASAEILFSASQLSSCSPQDRYILRSFFQRHKQMESGARDRLALKLLEQFLRKTNYQCVGTIDGELASVFLASLCRDLEKLARHGR